MAERYLREKSFRKWPILTAIIFLGIATQAAGQFSFLKAGQKKEVSILFAGDLMLGNELIPVIKELGADYPFDSVANVIREEDIAVANLESPLTVGGKAQKKKYTFAAPPSYIDGPVHAGFDLFTLANNHILDFGVDGLNSTLNTLRKTGVLFCGAGMNYAEATKPAIIMRDGIRFGFLAFSLTYPESFWAKPGKAGTAYVDCPNLGKIIRETKKSVDIVVVSFHWGGEYRERLKPYQVKYAHQAIDAGADIVIGHHPHTLQGLEIYRGKLIAYSLGNFIFGTRNPKAYYGALLKAWFSEKALVDAEIIPISVNNYKVQFQPKRLSLDERTSEIQHLISLSKGLNGGNEILNAGGVVRMKSN